MTRARARIREENSRVESDCETDIEHRQRLMSLARELPQGDALCVFAAGNADDLDSGTTGDPFFAKSIWSISTIKRWRARDRQSAAVRGKSCSTKGWTRAGLLEHSDDWGDCFPEHAELARVATEAAQSIVHGLGATFRP